MQIQIGPLTISTKALPANLSPPLVRAGGWWPLIRESFTGAWQRNVEVRTQDVLAYSTVWACVTLIASDIGKLGLDLKEEDPATGIKTTVERDSPFARVLEKPNPYMTRVKFFEHWMICKLAWGNTYALKERDQRGLVTSLTILDPQRVKLLQAPDGSVFYQLDSDRMAGITDESIIVPASEIIHDINVPLFHPLIGVSPIFACGFLALQGLKAQQHASTLFDHGAQLGGLIIVPTTISDEAAKRVLNNFTANFTGPENVGRIGMLTDGMSFQPQQSINAVDAQLIDQLRWTAEQICACFHVPGYMVGIGPPPPYTDIESVNLQYYNQALHNPIENLEELLGDGLELPTTPAYSVRFDIGTLGRMDSKTRMEVQKTGVGAGIFSPNEARAEFDRLPVAGGDTPYLQEQNYSLEALARRDQAPPTPQPAPQPTPQPAEPAPVMRSLPDLEARSFWLTRKELEPAA